MQPTYIDEAGARDHIRARGVRLGDTGLKDHRYRGTGPKHVLINGRVCYTREWCDEWISEEASRPADRVRRKQREQLPAG